MSWISRPRRVNRRAGFVGCLIVLGMALAAFSHGDALAAKKKRADRIRPAASAGPVKVKVGKKSSSYHKATQAKPLEFSIRGPATVRVLSRLMFAAPEQAKATTYAFRVEVGPNVLRTVTEKAGVSKSATLEGGIKIGSLEKSTIHLPAGKHRVRIVPVDANVALAVKILRGTGAKAKIKWTSFQPDAGAKAVRLHEKDQELTVYRFSPTQPVTVTLRGPLKMRVTTRLDFGLTNGVTQAYVIKASMDSKPAKSFALKSTASHTATYPDLNQITPGRPQSFEIVVPSGPHKIVLELSGTTAAGASARIQIPQHEPKAVAQ
jgi:hypothetical protein